MNWRSATALVSFLIAMLLAGIARADEDIPSFKVLTCEKDCPQRTAAVPINKPAAEYPSTRDESAITEGLVDVHYTIGTDGLVKDAQVERLIGPQEFADTALQTVRARTFKPATENGKPVEENRRVRFAFLMGDMGGARDEIVSAYSNATGLAKAGKTQDAIAAYNSILVKEHLNFYERTMVAYALARAYALSHDYPTAIKQIRIATIMEGHFLDRRTQENAIRLRIKLEAATGEIADAFAWFEILKKHATVGQDDPEATLVDKLHALIGTAQPLVMDALIPREEDKPAWQHTLLRRNFAFAQIDGALNRFALRCDQHGIESVVSDTAEWAVPKSWTGCVIYVDGAPGTKFKFIEMQPQ